MNALMPNIDEIVFYISENRKMLLIVVNFNGGDIFVSKILPRYFHPRALNDALLRNFSLYQRPDNLERLEWMLDSVTPKFKLVTRRTYSELFPQIKIYDLLDIPWIDKYGKILI